MLGIVTIPDTFRCKGCAVTVAEWKACPGGVRPPRFPSPVFTAEASGETVAFTAAHLPPAGVPSCKTASRFPGQGRGAREERVAGSAQRGSSAGERATHSFSERSAEDGGALEGF